MAVNTGLDLRDMMLEVEADVSEVVREVMQELSLPMVEQMYVKMWMQLPQAMKEQFKKDKPEQYAALMKMIG